MEGISYELNGSLYLNITNRCTNECGFCIRLKSEKFNNEHPLWLTKEPTAKEIIDSIGDPTKYQSIVFCGYGEPLIRLDIIKEVAKFVREKSVNGLPKIRINTNGHGNMFWGRNIAKELVGLVDQISVSLNAPNPEQYDKICSPIAGKKAFDETIKFIIEVKKYIPETSASVINSSNLNDIEESKKLAEKLGVTLRLRTYYEDEYRE